MATETPKIDEAAYRELLVKQAHRSPGGLRLTVLGDRGQVVELELVIGTPTGACQLPAPQQSPIWDTFVLRNLTDGTMPDNADYLGCFDSVLWPDLATWATWCERWPALSQRVWTAIKNKVGTGHDVPDGPGEHEKLPDEVVAELAKFPQAMVRRYSPSFNGHKSPFLFVIQPPASVAWRFFRDGLKKRPEDCWKETLAFARAHAKLVYDEAGKKLANADEVFTRWPGVALLETMAIHALAGATARFELGELFPGISAPG